METLQKTSKTRAIGAFSLLILGSVNTLSAGNDIMSDLQKGFSGSNLTSLYIIGGVLGFGILGYIIVSVISKYSKKEEKQKHIAKPHHHKHHHRVVKKST
jgi:hypothetical protein